MKPLALPQAGVTTVTAVTVMVAMVAMVAMTVMAVMAATRTIMAVVADMGETLCVRNSMSGRREKKGWCWPRYLS